jgi:alanyl-tRNA synthetase
MILNATPFYVESGGQVSDTGYIIADGDGKPVWKMEVTNVARPVTGLIVHEGILTEGTVSIGAKAVAKVDGERRSNIMRNHTATHILHRELRRILGDHVAQAGSLVAPDRLRFDFSHPQMVPRDKLDEIEAAVNKVILADLPVSDSQRMFSDLRQAIASGEVMALFGEKYGDLVRVVQIGANGQSYSQELCGGTHITRTSQIGTLHITGEGAVAAGVRRIEAVTGQAAQELTQQRLSILTQTAAHLGVPPDQVYQRAKSLTAQLQESDKRVRELQRKLARLEFEQMLAQTREIKGVKTISLKVDAPDVAMLREMSDWFRDRLGSGVVVLGAVIEGKPTIIATVTQDLTKQGLSAGDLVKPIAQMIGGSGGGRPTMAQAGGKDSSRLDEALAKVDALVSSAVG